MGKAMEHRDISSSSGRNKRSENFDRDQQQFEQIFEATARLATGVAHEINNPLQGIKAQLRLLADDGNLSEKGHERLKIVSQEVDRIATIVRKLLKLHQVPSTGTDESRLADIMEQIQPLLASRIEQQNVTFSTIVDPPDMHIPMAAGDLRQVILDLSLNAIDAMPEGGRLSIEGQRVNGNYVVRISDTGNGIRKEHLKDLLLPFFSTKGPQNAGLGLPVAYSTVRASCGRLELTKSDDAGTIISMFFPAGNSKKSSQT